MLPQKVQELLSRQHVRFSLLLQTSDITQGEFGAQLGVDQSAVSRWTRGQVRIPDRAISALAELTGVDAEWIRTGAGVQGSE